MDTLIALTYLLQDCIKLIIFALVLVFGLCSGQ